MQLTFIFIESLWYKTNLFSLLLAVCSLEGS